MPENSFRIPPFGQDGTKLDAKTQVKHQEELAVKYGSQENPKIYVEDEPDAFIKALQDDVKERIGIGQSLQALRYNEDKLQWSLVDFKSLEPLVRVLEYGSNKYSLNLDFSCASLLQLCNKIEFAISATTVKGSSQEDFVKAVTHLSSTQKQFASDAIGLKQFVQKACVLLATKQTELIHPLKKQPQDETTRLNIALGPNLKRESDKEQLKEHESLDMQKLKSAVSFCVELQNTESLKVFTTSELNLDVKFAKALNDCTLITVIQLEDTEVFFAASATTQLDCFKIILSLFKKLQIISEKVQINKNGFFLSGKHNWKKGLPKNEILESLLRHVFALLDGETHCPESLQHHIGHIQANAMFYAYMDRNLKQKENDNG